MKTRLSVVSAALFWVAVVVWHARAEDPVVLFRRAAEAHGRVRLSGIEVTERTSKKTGKTLVVERRVLRDTGGREYSEYISGPEMLVGQRVICDGRRRYRVIPAWKIALRSPDLGPPERRVDHPSRYVQEALKRLDVLLDNSEPEVAGRPAYLLTLMTRAKGPEAPRKQREILVDRATFTTLENREFHAGVRVQRTYFSSVDFDSEIDPGWFRYVPGPDVLVLPEPSWVPVPLDDRSRPWWGPMAAPVPQNALPAGWGLKGELLLSFGRTPVVQSHFRVEREGLPAMFYRRRLADAATHFDEFFGTAQANGVPQSLTDHAWVWRDDALIYVLTSRIPPEELAGAAQRLSRACRASAPSAPAGSASSTPGPAPHSGCPLSPPPRSP